ncbi:MAG: flagellar basal-body rod protein FlgC [Limisphaerales bacterium]|jgi:flagellar basal-body rod protein FlgC
MNLIPGLESTTAALDAERIRMQVVTQNIANAHTTKGADGKLYKRQQVIFSNVMGENLASGLEAPIRKVVVSKIIDDKAGPKLIYNPGHPDAGPEGMVAMPNINVHSEMVDMMAAMRAFEANLAAIKTSREMAAQTLSIGR